MQHQTPTLKYSWFAADELDLLYSICQACSTKRKHQRREHMVLLILDMLQVDQTTCTVAAKAAK